MARWQTRPTATFEDLPAPLRDLPLDAPAELRERRNAWLEANNLALVDLLGWLRARSPGARRRPPSRRKWLPPAAQRELDAQREREGWRW